MSKSGFGWGSSGSGWGKASGGSSWGSVKPTQVKSKPITKIGPKNK